MHNTQKANHKCSFCGCTYETFSFKHGYVCDGCLQYIKNVCKPESKTDDKHANDKPSDDRPENESSE